MGRDPEAGRAAQEAILFDGDPEDPGLHAWISTNTPSPPLTREDLESFFEMLQPTLWSSQFEVGVEFGLADRARAEAEDQDQRRGDQGQHHVLEGEVHEGMMPGAADE